MGNPIYRTEVTRELASCWDANDRLLCLWVVQSVVTVFALVGVHFSVGDEARGR